MGAFIAFIPENSVDDDTVQIIKIDLLVENGISHPSDLETVSVQLCGGRIRDIKFADAAELRILWDSDGKL